MYLYLRRRNHIDIYPLESIYRKDPAYILFDMEISTDNPPPPRTH